MDKTITCLFTGNREIPKTEYKKLLQDTEAAVCELYRKGYRNFIAGGAVGFDTLAARVVIKLRETLDIKLYLVLPCADQAKNFSAAQRSEYELIKQKADGVYVMYQHYVRGCMHVRNRKMVNNSSACIAFKRKPAGGTAYTVDYAQKLGLYIIYL